MKTGRTFFVADLHLTDERPVSTGRVFRFLQDEAAGGDALYILGDLFEAWVGDDHDEQDPHDTAQQLKALAASGTPVYFMHGNRDFMLAGRYAALSGMTLLADPSRIDLYGVPTLLMHGDTLCTDDTADQAFRRKVRHPLSLTALRRLPLSLRHRDRCLVLADFGQPGRVFHRQPHDWAHRRNGPVPHRLAQARGVSGSGGLRQLRGLERGRHQRHRSVRSSAWARWRAGAR